MIFQIINALPRTCTATLAILGILPLSGCLLVGHDPYPDTWETRPSFAEGVCADIAGTFEPALKSVFWNRFEQREWYERSLEATHLTIEQSSGTLSVSAWAGAARVARVELRKDRKEYLCKKDGLGITGRNSPPENMLGYVKETYTLFKTADGALVAKVEEVGGGLALGVAPAYVNGTTWVRYRPIR